MSAASQLYPEEISNKAQGHKANISNPDTSEESKEHSRRVLKELGGEDAFYSKDESTSSTTTSQNNSHDTSDNEKNVLAGHKATLSNKNASEEAKQHSRQVLEQAGVLDAQEKDTHVLAGHKAAIANPNVSQEAKEHSAEVLKGAGVSV